MNGITHLNRRWLALLTLVVVSAAALAVLVYWLFGPDWRYIPIADAARPESFVISARSADQLVSGISIQVTGEIEGAAEISGDGWWQPERLSGRVNRRIHRDWYDPNCTLHYKPLGPVSGHLTIAYKFE